LGLTKGHTFGAAEQVNNTKLHNLVDLATVDLESSEVTTSFLSSLASTAGSLQWHNIYQQSLASGVAVRHDGSGGIYFA
jgi:hypothetical protein